MAEAAAEYGMDAALSMVYDTIRVGHFVNEALALEVPAPIRFVDPMAYPGASGHPVSGNCLRMGQPRGQHCSGILATKTIGLTYC